MHRTEKNLHPILSLVFSLFLFVSGLLFVKEKWFLIYILTFLIILLIFRFGGTILKIMPLILIFGSLMALITTINGSRWDVLYSFYRVFALVPAITLSMSIKPVHLVRSFNQIKVPHWISLGFLIVIRFVRIFLDEIRQIRQAIILRGIRFTETPVLWGRAFFIPLIIRVLSISENLAVSLETRAFSTEVEGTAYETITFEKRNYIFAIMSSTCLAVYIYLFIGGEL
ncbi:MAG TPA: energy-coupling factor transporter transmembrane protein EcfT [Mogibacterium sp.]|nr:energy-coupling factor transporter transmembrane protein EcfT [Mogibacterium sp.]